MMSMPFLRGLRTAERGARKLQSLVCVLPQREQQSVVPMSTRGPTVDRARGTRLSRPLNTRTVHGQRSATLDPFSSRGRVWHRHEQLLKKGRYGSPFHNWLVGG